MRSGWRGTWVNWELLEEAREEFVLVLDEVDVHHVHRDERKPIVL